MTWILRRCSERRKSRCSLWSTRWIRVGAPPPEIYEFYHLGLGDFYAVSSAHGLGIGEVLDAILAYLPEPGDAEEEGSCIKAAVVGKPNARKIFPH